MLPAQVSQWKAQPWRIFRERYERGGGEAKKEVDLRKRETELYQQTGYPRNGARLVGGNLGNLGADELLLEMADRKLELMPYPPPGSSEVVQIL